jgi:hypothetical protein
MTDHRSPRGLRSRRTLFGFVAVYLGTAAVNGLFAVLTGASWHIPLAVVLLAIGLVLLAVAARERPNPRPPEDCAGSHSRLHPPR